METANFPRGQTTYQIVDIEEDVRINTVVEMDGTPMVERKINDIITTIYDGEHILLPAYAKALEIIKKRTNPAGMMNRHYVFQSAAILQQMKLEMQVTSQALGSMDVMTHAQEDFSVLITTRKIQNQVMSAYDIRLKMLLQGSQLSTGTAEQSLTNCMVDSLRTAFSIQNRNLPPTVSAMSCYGIEAIKFIQTFYTMIALCCASKKYFYYKNLTYLRSNLAENVPSTR